eukprot:14960518-Alexandrium_andersonii.AAC.1
MDLSSFPSRLTARTAPARGKFHKIGFHRGHAIASEWRAMANPRVVVVMPSLLSRPSPHESK